MRGRSGGGKRERCNGMDFVIGCMHAEEKTCMQCAACTLRCDLLHVDRKDLRLRLLLTLSSHAD